LALESRPSKGGFFLVVRFRRMRMQFVAWMGLVQSGQVITGSNNLLAVLARPRSPNIGVKSHAAALLTSCKRASEFRRAARCVGRRYPQTQAAGNRK